MKPDVRAIGDVQAAIRSLRQERPDPFGNPQPVEPPRPRGRRRPAKRHDGDDPTHSGAVDVESPRPFVDPATVRMPDQDEVRAVLAGGGAWRIRMSYDDIETPAELKVLLNAGILDEDAIDEDMYWVKAAVLVDWQQRPLFRLRPLEGWTPLAHLLGFGKGRNG